jgi:NAD(P)-dependent dehydrogenase (short-subunit alcohol dehydrogenase family)
VVVADLDGLGYRGTTAVVVGCSTGIGAGVAKLLGQLGAEVHAVSRSRPSLPIESFHPVDLAAPHSITAAIGSLAAIGPIDHVVVAAGVPKMRAADLIMRVNYLGVRHLVDALVPSMRRGGSIGLVSSNTAFGWENRMETLLELVRIDDIAEATAWCETHPEAVGEEFATYVFSKQALMAWTVDSAVHLGEEHGIKINCTAPGPTASPMIEEIMLETGREVFDIYPHPILGRTVTPEEQAWALLLANTPLNPTVTGTVIFTDEGITTGGSTGSISLTERLSVAARPPGSGADVREARERSLQRRP